MYYIFGNWYENQDGHDWSHAMQAGYARDVLARGKRVDRVAPHSGSP
jgi:hypothetical protein